jgi:hypothetical protein
LVTTRLGISLILQNGLLVGQRGRVLRLLVVLKDSLDLLAQTLALGRVAVAAVLLFVDIAFAAAAGMEVLLVLAQCGLGDQVFRAAAFTLGSYARRLG